MLTIPLYMYMWKCCIILKFACYIIMWVLSCHLESLLKFLLSFGFKFVHVETWSSSSLQLAFIIRLECVITQWFSCRWSFHHLPSSNWNVNSWKCLFCTRVSGIHTGIQCVKWNVTVSLIFWDFTLFIPKVLNQFKSIPVVHESFHSSYHC